MKSRQTWGHSDFFILLLYLAHNRKEYVKLLILRTVRCAHQVHIPHLVHRLWQHRPGVRCWKVILHSVRHRGHPVYPVGHRRRGADLCHPCLSILETIQTHHQASRQESAASGGSHPVPTSSEVVSLTFSSARSTQSARMATTTEKAVANWVFSQTC